jgi:hypothetical protein
MESLHESSLPVVDEFGPKAPGKPGVVRRAREVRLSPLASAAMKSPLQMTEPRHSQASSRPIGLRARTQAPACTSQLPTLAGGSPGRYPIREQRRLRRIEAAPKEQVPPFRSSASILQAPLPIKLM